jgi:hypothetical protein
MQLLDANLLRGEISSIRPKEFVQELEASLDSIFETVALMEVEEAGADRIAAEAGTHVHLNGMENKSYC